MKMSAADKRQAKPHLLLARRRTPTRCSSVGPIYISLILLLDRSTRYRINDRINHSISGQPPKRLLALGKGDRRYAKGLIVERRSLGKQLAFDNLLIDSSGSHGAKDDANSPPCQEEGEILSIVFRRPIFSSMTPSSDWHDFCLY